MTYQDSANLAADIQYLERLSACVTTEAIPKPADQFVDQVLRNPGFASQAFAATVAVAPGFGDKFAMGGQSAVTDGDLLSAVQASWDRIAALYLPPAP